MSSRSPFILAAIIALGGVACQSATPEDLASVGHTSSAIEVITPGWSDTYFTSMRVIGRIINLAGRDLNGIALNGKDLEGRIVVSVALSGAMVEGEPAKDVALDGSVFVGRKSGNRVLKPEQWVGAEFSGMLDDGEAISLRIDERIVSAKKSERDLVKYVVSYSTVDGRKPLCGVDASGAPVAAIPLSGRWDYRSGLESGGAKTEDPSVFTFACEGYVLAKCVHMGYRPWWPAMKCTKGGGCEKSTLSEHHQACTRMLRADYCGNGVSHTVDGTSVNVYDGAGVRSDGENWALEAEWTASGARCAAVERISEPNQPSCWSQLASATCGSTANFATGTLLISEVQSTP